MTEERLVYFDIAEVMERAEGMESVMGLPAPDASYSGTHIPMAVMRIEDAGDEGPVRTFFTVTVPGSDKDGLTEELWSNAVLNAATVILEDELRGEAKERGLELSEMRGPGLGGLPAELSSAIVELTGADRIGVTVNEDHVMSPPFTRCGLYTAAAPGSKAEEGPEAGCGSCLGKAQGCVLCMRNRNLL